MGNLWSNSTFLCDAYRVFQGDIYSSESILDSLSNFQSYFGLNSWQDINVIYIKKSDLPQLTPHLNNTAESLFIAIMKNVIAATTEESLVTFEFWRGNRELSQLQYLLNIYFPIEYDALGNAIDFPDDVNPNDI